MKKNNNIKQLKEIVNNDLFFDLHYQGVQAYNISSANEYEVITGFRKCNGRYYFIDRNGNKYLASRYDRADFIAGEMLEQKAREDETVAEAIDGIEKTGKTKILIELAWEYRKACKARGINPGELIDTEEDNAGNVYMIHCVETAKDEENNEDNENAAACEPSMFAGILAKTKDFAQSAAEKAAFVLSLVVIFAVGLLSVCVAVSSVASIIEALGLLGSIWGAIIGLVLVLTVGFDFMSFVVINAMAVLARIFPSEFEKAQKPRFTKPFSFWHRLITESL